MSQRELLSAQCMIALLLGLLSGCGRPTAIPTVSPMTEPATSHLTQPAVTSPAPDSGRVGRIVVSCCDIDDIYAMNRDGSGRLQLTTSPAPDFDPTCLPDGTRIAFRSERDGNPEIYVMNADGSQQINLTRNPAEDWSPAWSPDGQAIAFASARDGGIGDIFAMNADGSQPRNLTQRAGIDEYPAWSPDSQHIAFRRKDRDGAYALYVIETDRTGLRRILDRPSADQVWWPDGNTLLVPRRGLRIVDAGGSELAQLKTMADAFPCGLVESETPQ
jgi:Tol biopolymer transport system component